MDELIEDEFLSSEFLEDELPEDFFLSQFIDLVKQDPCSAVLKERLVVQDVETSHFCSINYETEEIAIGPKYIENTIYYIDPDFYPCDVMIEYYEKFMQNENHQMPDIPVAQPVVPTNKIYKCDEEYRLERTVMNRNCYLAEPRPGQYAVLGGTGMFATSRGAEGSKAFRELPNGQRIFQSYDDRILRDDSCSHLMRIGMQFNPFHPMSKEKITSFEWENEFNCKGTYKYRNREVYFHFDLRSSYYRVHSDQWIPCLGLQSGYYEVYDFVSDKDFAKELGFSFVNNCVEPFVIEPVIRTVNDYTRPLVYSILGPWEGQISRGMSDGYYSPSTTIMKVESKDFEWFEDITAKCELDLRKMTLVVVDGNKSTVVLLKKKDRGKKKNNKGPKKKKDESDPFLDQYMLQSDSIFIKISRYTFQSFEWRVFRRCGINQDGSLWTPRSKEFPFFKFTIMKGVFYRSFPTNRFGTISYGLVAINMLDALGMDRRKHHEFLPLTVPPLPCSYFASEKSLDFDINIENSMVDIDLEFI